MTRFFNILFFCFSDEVVTLKDETKFFGFRISSKQTGIKRQTPFFHACANGLLDVIKLLMNGMTTVNAKCSESGRTALHFACLNGDVKLFEWLLSHPDIDVNAIDNDGKTALHILCKNDQVEKQKHQLQILQTLIKNAKNLKLNFNVKTKLVDLDYVERTPFHLACKYGTYDVVKLLMENVEHCGIDINAEDGFGWTGLYWTRDRDKKFERLIQGRGNDGLLWRLRDCFFFLYEREPLMTVLLTICLILIVIQILQDIWSLIRLNFTECDCDCQFYHKYGIVFVHK